MKKIAVILLILALLAGGGAFAYHQMMGASTLTEEVKVEIPEASSTDAIGAILAENGVVKSELGFKLQVKKDGAASELKAGTYHFKAGQYSLGDVVDCLMKGPAVSGVKVTIPEGYNQSQIVGLLVDAGLCTEEAFLEAAANCDFG